MFYIISILFVSLHHLSNQFAEVSMELNMQDIGSRIKKRRKELQLTQHQIKTVKHFMYHAADIGQFYGYHEEKTFPRGGFRFYRAINVKRPCKAEAKHH